jgi:leucyl aminopeptidase
VRVEVSSKPITEVEADLVAIGVFQDEDLPDGFADAPGASDAKGGFKKLATLRPSSPERVVAVGLGKRDDLDAERLRVAAALAAKQAAGFEARTIAWHLPRGDGVEADAAAAAVTEGTAMAAFRFDRFRSRDPEDPEPPELETLTLVGGEGAAAAAEAALVSAEAANRARELQSLPSNVKNPSFLAARAEEIGAAHEAISVEVLGPVELEKLGMGGILAVSAGSAQEPRLIVMRYAGADDGAETLGWVGKGVTFDSGGISIKPAQSMHEMKMDMSGAAAVMEGVGAIAELGVGVNVLAVAPCVENMPSGSATRPGDIITQHNGKTVEVLNTDAEGRLILADALSWCAEQGADRIVDLATLTGAIVTALGSTYAGLLSNDDEWAERVQKAAERSGELAWRLPLHDEYKDLTKGKLTDLVNSSDKRKAGPIYAASFLEEFVDGKPWVHLDIAGTAWNVGREYVGNGPTGFGVRLLIALAQDLATAS